MQLFAKDLMQQNGYRDNCHLHQDAILQMMVLMKCNTCCYTNIIIAKQTSVCRRIDIVCANTNFYFICDVMVNI